MRAIQFWILLLCSLAFTGLQIKAVYLSRSVVQEQSVLEDSQATAATQPAYENAWKQLALHIYQVSGRDPALTKILKDQKIEITATPVQVPDLPPALAPGASTPTSGTTTPAAQPPEAATLPPPAPVTGKQQVGPLHP